MIVGQALSSKQTSPPEESSKEESKSQPDSKKWNSSAGISRPSGRLREGQIPLSKLSERTLKKSDFTPRPRRANEKPTKAIHTWGEREAIPHFREDVRMLANMLSIGKLSVHTIMTVNLSLNKL